MRARVPRVLRPLQQQRLPSFSSPVWEVPPRVPLLLMFDTGLKGHPPHTHTPIIALSCPRSDDGARCQDEKSPSSCQDGHSTESFLHRKVSVLVEFLTENYI